MIDQINNSRYNALVILCATLYLKIATRSFYMFTIKYILYVALLIPSINNCMKKEWEAECTQERRAELLKQFSESGFLRFSRHEKIKKLMQEKNPDYELIDGLICSNTDAKGDYIKSEYFDPSNGFPALFDDAISSGNIAFAQRFMEKYYDPEEKFNRHVTHATHTSREMTQFLLSTGIDILNARSCYIQCRSHYPGCHLFESAYKKARQEKEEKEHKEFDDYFRQLKEKKKLEKERLIEALRRTCAEKK